RSGSPQELDERRLARSRGVGLGDEQRIPGFSRGRNRAHVLNDANAADNRRGRDGAAVGLVVERDVPRDDRDLQRRGWLRDPVDRLCQLPTDLGLLRVAEVEAIGQREGTAAGARDLARRGEHRARARYERIELADTRPVERHRDPSVARTEPQHAGSEPWAAHRPRLDELVVLLVDPRLALVVRRRDRTPLLPRLRVLLHLVARALVREEGGRDRALEVSVE